MAQWKAIASGALAVMVSACAHHVSTLPPDSLAATAAATGAAKQAGAEKIPAAARHLKLAYEQVERARMIAAQDGDSDGTAERLLERARADADLALALAMAKTSRDATDEVSDSLRTTTEDQEREEKVIR
jgi:hypothetical protein